MSVRRVAASCPQPAQPARTLPHCRHCRWPVRPGRFSLRQCYASLREGGREGEGLPRTAPHCPPLDAFLSRPPFPFPCFPCRPTTLRDTGCFCPTREQASFWRRARPGWARPHVECVGERGRLVAYLQLTRISVCYSPQRGRRYYFHLVLLLLFF